MESSNNKKYKECFIICPIGEFGSDTRRKSDGLINAVLKPVLADFFETVYAPLDLSKSGNISDQVIDKLLTVDLVVANLTELNPNVMYELAVRHAKHKPVIILAERGTVLPFDIYAERTLWFDDAMDGVPKLSTEFRKSIIDTMGEIELDNPIYRVIQSNLFKDSKTKTSAEQIIFDRLLSIETYLRMSYRGHYFINHHINDQIADIVLRFEADIPDSELSRIANSLTTSYMPITFKVTPGGDQHSKNLNLYINHLQPDQVEIISENVKRFKHDKKIGFYFNLQLS